MSEPPSSNTTVDFDCERCGERRWSVYWCEKCRELDAPAVAALEAACKGNIEWHILAGDARVQVEPDCEEIVNELRKSGWELVKQ